MDGVTDAPMRALQGEMGGFGYAVSEFVRVTREPVPARVFLRHVPELAQAARTLSGLPVHVQLLGGEAEPMAQSALIACQVGAQAIDLNFGCPAPVVNRHDGGASLLRHPQRLRSIVAAVRSAVPAHIPVSAKLRLGWDCSRSIDENAAMAAEGGANWLTIHARTKSQGYRPPVEWAAIARVRTALEPLPIIANGDIWSVQDLRRCQQESGCLHFMLGRGALADPGLAARAGRELGLDTPLPDWDWPCLMARLLEYSRLLPGFVPQRTLTRFKQWLRLASTFGKFAHFDRIKTTTTVEEFFSLLPSG